MHLESWLVLAGTIGVVVLVPGPSVSLVWAQRVQYGPRAVSPTIAGDLTANMLQLAVAWIGLSRIRALGAPGRLVALAGAAYIGYLGVCRMRGTPSAPHASIAGPAHSGPGARTFFARGFVVSAANPKAIVFFMSLLPVAMGRDGSGLAPLLIVAATFMAMDGSVLAAYAAGGGCLRDYLIRHRRGHWERRIAGAMLLAAAIGLGWIGATGEVG